MASEKHYFDQVKKLPTEVSLSSVEQFVLQGPPAPAFWKKHFLHHLNSIIMSSIILISLGLFFFLPESTSPHQAKALIKSEQNLDMIEVITQIDQQSLAEFFDYEMPNIKTSLAKPDTQTAALISLPITQNGPIVKSTTNLSSKENSDIAAATVAQEKESKHSSTGEYQSFELKLFGDEPTSSWNPKVLQAKENGLFVQVYKIKRNKDGSIKKIEFYLKAKSPDGKDYYKSFVTVESNYFQSLEVKWDYNERLGVDQMAYKINDGRWTEVEDVYNSCSKMKISSK
ncbi:MAG: hypothetical protein NWQ53_08785 [Flavobacteriales bacterium]|nr:hypothetical protein [Flavobacteriales bacterium]